MTHLPNRMTDAAYEKALREAGKEVSVFKADFFVHNPRGTTPLPENAGSGDTSQPGCSSGNLHGSCERNKPISISSLSSNGSGIRTEPGSLNCSIHPDWKTNAAPSFPEPANHNDHHTTDKNLLRSGTQQFPTKPGQRSTETSASLYPIAITILKSLISISKTLKIYSPGSIL